MGADFYITMAQILCAARRFSSGSRLVELIHFVETGLGGGENEVPQWNFGIPLTRYNMGERPAHPRTICREGALGKNVHDF